MREEPYPLGQEVKELKKNPVQQLLLSCQQQLASSLAVTQQRVDETKKQVDNMKKQVDGNTDTLKAILQHVVKLANQPSHLFGSTMKSPVAK